MQGERVKQGDSRLSDLRPGESGRVRKLVSQGAMRRRLYDMGITPDCMITIRKMAPLGDPIQIMLRGYSLTIRKDDADCILMRDIETYASKKKHNAVRTGKSGVVSK